MAKERFINARTRRRGFTTVLNQMLDDPTLSLEAKGLLTILLSNKDDWKINMKEIISRSKNGRDAHYRVINELINSGYFFRIQIKEKGKFKEVIYVFSDDKEEVKEAVKELEDKGLLPHPENQETVFVSPFPENPETENPYPENQDNNNTNTKKTNTNNTNTSMYVGNESPEHEEQIETKELQMCVIDNFASNYKLTGYARKNLIELMEIHGEALVAESLKRAINSETEKPIAYIKGILKKWSMADVKTVEDIHTYESNFRKNQQQKKQPKQNKHKQNDLPESIRKQEEEKQKQGEQTENKTKEREHEKDESWKQKEAEIRGKIRLLMKERFQKKPAY